MARSRPGWRGRAATSVNPTGAHSSADFQGEQDMTRRFLPAMLLAAALSACSSGAKLSDVPVGRRTGTAVNPQGGTPQTQSRVEPVQADLATDPRGGPANVSRLVYFDYDSFEIKPEFQAVIEAHARYLRANPQRRVALEGHTDER